MSKPFRRAVGTYQGAAGLKDAVKSATTDNSKKFVVQHKPSGLFLSVEDEGYFWVDGGRNDGTGFATEEAAREYVREKQIRASELVIKRPTR